MKKFTKPALGVLVVAIAVLACETPAVNRAAGTSASPNPQIYAEHRAQLKYAAVDGGKLAYIDRGQGKAILLLHGFPSSSWIYRQVIPPLVDAGYRVVAPDMLGFGSSSKPKDQGQLDHDLQAKRLLQLMDRLTIGSFGVVLHDIGGIWTWEMLGMAPGRIDALVLLNTFAYREGWNPPHNLDGKSQAWDDVLQVVMDGELLGMTLFSLVIKEGVIDQELCTSEMVNGYWRPLQEGGADTLVHFRKSLKTIIEKLPVYQQNIRSSGIPATIIWGRQDSILVADKLVPQFARDLSIEEHDIHVLEDAKHFIQEEQPETVSRLIVEFMQRQLTN